ncbi:hypothetical protein [Sulfurovum sp.]|uniref:hypothetical protein n=1 Tax=Sulfurovum sp. TaxID=1969726 RepID=UPI0028682028|nr:hypothetical protein [Sulfurovum sp.]
MNKVRIVNLEKKLNTTTRKHREIKLVNEDTKGVYTTRDGRPLTKNNDGSFLFEDGTVHYDANEPNPYNEFGLILRTLVSGKRQERDKKETRKDKEEIDQICKIR